MDNRSVILVTRGHDPAPNKPEEPGALKVFAYRQGLLTKEVSIAPNGGYGFGPRHLDFHPTRPWVYVSLERQSIMPLLVKDGAARRTILASLAVFRIGGDGRLDFVRKYDVDVGDKTMFWMGMVAR